MAFQTVPHTAEIDIIYTQNGETVQNVFYAELSGGYVLADLAVLAAAIDAQVQGSWKTQQNTDAVYVRTEVRGLTIINDLVAEDNTNAGAGGHVGGALPNNVTLCVKKSSGLTGRSARGRCYWIGAAKGELVAADENRFDDQYVADVVAAVDDIRSAINGAALWTPVLVSRFTEGSARAFGVTFPWVSSSSINTVADTQRGRMP